MVASNRRVLALGVFRPQVDGTVIERGMDDDSSRREMEAGDQRGMEISSLAKSYERCQRAQSCREFEPKSTLTQTMMATEFPEDWRERMTAQLSVLEQI